jgi:putative hemolysin
MIRTALKTVSIDARSIRHALEKIEQRSRLHRHRVPEFQPNVSFAFEKGDYLVKTADNGAELEECLKLRFEVFHREFLEKKRTYGVDVDKLDLVCDHLVVIDKKSEKIVGTYRLNCSRFTGLFYSAGEFDLGGLLELPGHKLELGRACIDRNFRNGAVVNLLWRGIAEYLKQTESSYLFGCASVKTTDAAAAALACRYLASQGLIDKSFGVAPIGKFRFKKLKVALGLPGASGPAGELELAAGKALLPPLFMSYVKMGAKILGEPALDRDYRCIDFLTLLKVDELHPIFARKYRS